MMQSRKNGKTTELFELAPTFNFMQILHIFLQPSSLTSLHGYPNNN